MNRSESVNHSIEFIAGEIRKEAARIRRRGVTALFIYGSRARGDNRADSDLDVYVDYDAGSTFSLLELARVKTLLESLVGFEVHITTANSIPAASMRTIEKESIKVL